MPSEHIILTAYFFSHTYNQSPAALHPLPGIIVFTTL